MSMTRSPFLVAVTAATTLALAAGVSARPSDSIPSSLLRPPISPGASYEGEGLNSDLVYAVLVGDIAVQRGDYRMAFTHFLHAARLSKRADMAELATHAALRTRDPKSIDRALAAWLELDANSRAGRQTAALVHIQREERDKALEHLGAIVEMEEDRTTGFMTAAHLIARVADVSERMALMTALASPYTDDADAQYALAMVADSAGRADVAVAAAERAAALRPGWSRAGVLLARIHLREGRPDQAREVLERLVEELPENKSVRTMLAQFLVQQDELEAAREQYLTLLNEEPDDAALLLKLGALSLELDEYDAARDYLQRLYESGRQLDQAALMLGRVAELTGRGDEAISWYEKVGGENLIDARLSIARVHSANKRTDTARDMVQQLRDQWPDEAVTFYLFEAEILRDVDRDDEAMAIYNEALERFPNDADILYARALHGAKLRDVALLEHDLALVLEKDPDHADALNALGYTLADQTDRYQEAFGYIERALELKPEDPAILDSMGWVSFRLGDMEQALKYLRRALALMPDGEIAAHLGEVLWATGRHDEAWSVWDKALAEDPDHDYLLEVIGRHNVSRSGDQ